MQESAIIIPYWGFSIIYFSAILDNIDTHFKWEYNAMLQHVHDPSEKKRQINRISRVIGHLEHVKKMLENDEDCAAVLIQLSAARSALGGLGKQIIKEHMSHCIYHAIEDGDTQAVEEFQNAIEKFM